MFISLPILILIILVLGYYHAQETNEVIAEMRDPGGSQRLALLDARSADRTARKHARGPSGAIVGLLGIFCALLGVAWLVWGNIGVVWGLWLIVGPCLVVAAMSLRLPKNFGLGFLYCLTGLALSAFIVAAIKYLIVILK